jgi:hypothetical protein
MASPAAVAVAVGVGQVITQAVAVAEPAQQEEMQRCHHHLAVNTVPVLPDKDIPVVEVAAIFTPRVKVVAD